MSPCGCGLTKFEDELKHIDEQTTQYNMSKFTELDFIFSLKKIQTMKIIFYENL